jgi:hypothetical protein
LEVLMPTHYADLPQFLIKPDRRRTPERRASGLGGRRSTDELSDLVVLESARSDGWISRRALAAPTHLAAVPEIEEDNFPPLQG